MIKKLTLAEMHAEINAWGGRIEKHSTRTQGTFYTYYNNVPRATETGRTLSEAIRLGYADMQATKAQETAAPVDAPQEAPVNNVPLTDENKGRVKGSYKDLLERIAALETERDALQLSVHGLQAQLQKAQAENVQLKVVLQKAVVAMLLVESNMNIDEAQRKFNAHAQQAQAPTPAQESPATKGEFVAAPKFEQGQVVKILVHIDKVSGSVIDRKLEDNQWHYKVERPFTGITMWYTESELS